MAAQFPTLMPEQEDLGMQYEPSCVMALFWSAVRSLICRVPFGQAPAVLARGRGMKDVVRMAS